MNTLDFIKNRYNCNFDGELPIVLPYSRMKELPKLFRKLGFKVGVEIGVSTGRYSKNLIINIPELKLYGVDPYDAYDEYVELHGEYGSSVMNKAYQTALARLERYPNYEFIREKSMDALKHFKDESLDFVYIDGNHTFEYAINDIAEWSKKVKYGGIIAGHDYCMSGEKAGWWTYEPTKEEIIKLCQVQVAVDAWTKANQIRPWFILTAKDSSPSWFWVKTKVQ